MNFILRPGELILMILASWVNQQQQEVIEYLRTENQILKEKLGKKRILLDDNQRRRLAVKGKVLGRKLLEQVGTLFTPDTILRWHRQLVANKWNYSDRRQNVGRPPLSDNVKQLVVKFARENPTWGYDRIADALGNIGNKLSDSTVANVLRENGIEPAPKRQRSTSWNTFIKAHWDILAAIDFTTVEVWTTKGLVTFYLLFAIELKTRKVQLVSCSTTLGDPFMKQIARNLTDPFDGFLKDSKYVLMDRDSNFSEQFQKILQDAGAAPQVLPAKSPNLNAWIERFHLSIKSECLDRMIFFGEASLRKAVREYLAHYHQERNHQGIDHKIIEPGLEVGPSEGEIVCKERLGGMLKYYHRQAA